MPREKDPELRAELLRETDAAIQVRPLGGSDAGLSWWIPRSQIGYMRKDTANPPGGAIARVVFTLPEWMIEKKDLWSLVP